MSPKVKLQLKELKVQSFVTNVEQEKVKGGIPYSCNSCQLDCSVTYIWYCPPTATDEPFCYTACVCG